MKENKHWENYIFLLRINIKDILLTLELYKTTITNIAVKLKTGVLDSFIGVILTPATLWANRLIVNKSLLKRQLTVRTSEGEAGHKDDNDDDDDDDSFSFW